MTEIISSILIAIALTAIGSRWIDFLYSMPSAPLSFPKEIASRSKFRKPCLFIFLTLCLIKIFTAPAPLNFYMATEIFFLALIIFTDFEQYVIFDKMLIPFAIIGVVATIHLNLPIIDRIVAAVIGGGIFLLMVMLTGGIGGGDIKLVAVLGIWLGTENLLNVVLIASIVGGICAGIMILTKIKGRKSYFAYGPYFALAAIFIIFSN
ncbi:MAG: prepilin peptidase [Selenomonadaceae bacterium]|nr:prepilin peptidase [Selenomonadaceae bacterium]